MIKADEIGRIIRYHRKQSGLSRQALAILAGVGKTVIYDIEKGKETIELKSLLKVLEALNIQLTLDEPSESRVGEQ